MGTKNKRLSAVVAALALGICAPGAMGQGFSGGLKKADGSSLAPEETPWKPSKGSSKFGSGIKSAKKALKKAQKGGSFTSGLTVGQAMQMVTPRHMYVWDNTIPGDVNATAELVKFCKSRFISRVFIECSPVGYNFAGAIANYDDFITTLNASNIHVYALNGYAWFTVSPTAGLPGQPTGWTEGWTIYQNVASSGLNFRGIVDDSVPYGVQYDLNGVTVDRFWDDTQTAAQEYLDYLRGIDARIGSLEFISTMPFWYDQDSRLLLALDGNKKAQPLNSYVQDIVDTVNVLSYRDRAFGSNGIIASVLGEIKQGPVLIGCETQDLGANQTSLTFFDDSISQMEGQLFYTWLPFRNWKYFAGMTIHDYSAYRNKQ